MKKILALALLLVLPLMAGGTASEAAPKRTWDEFVAEMEKKEIIEEKGPAVIAKYNTASGEEYELWKKLGGDNPAEYTKAAVTLVCRMFPDGNPANWEEVGGLVKGSERPRQLIAMDAFFTALQVLSENEEDIWGAAYLLQKFVSSSRGQLVFIDVMADGVRPVIDKIVKATGVAGVWPTTKIRGRMPLCPVYRGRITYGIAVSRDMQMMDGYARVAGNGSYAWDRDRGYFFEVVPDRDPGSCTRH